EEMSVLVDPNSPFFDDFTEAERLNMMVVGVNQKMTDVIMVVSWDMKNDKVDVISVPRDTYYERSGYSGAGQKKINSIYGSEGIVGTANAVSDVLFGMPINYYAVVDYEAVETIVDDIGGVPMDVQKTMEYKDPYDDPPLEIYIPAGYQVLDGKHAVQFLRYRKGYADGDIGRIAAQQEFIKSAFKQCISHGIVKSVKTICNNVESDLTLGAASKYALSAMGLKDDSITTYTLPGLGQYIGVTSYFVQDTSGTEAMLTQIYGSATADQQAA
ncbi:MAG: LCP family protein, partial [Firmicutes bacterium]|nr:LCP family protein [Bacillota bacterium]